MKEGMKELEPKLFNDTERTAFDVADGAEWQQWLLHKTATVVPEHLEHKIPKDNIIAAPMRYVRTNRAKVG